MSTPRIIGILQPGYLPWLGFFEQMARSDVFVMYDDVQFDKQGWRNRNRIKTKQGIHWLSVPVSVSGMPPVNEVLIDASQKKWAKKHLMAIRQSYARAPFLEQYLPELEQVYAQPFTRLIDLDLALMHAIARALGIDTQKVVLASELGIGGGKTERLINICHHFKGDVFYEGAAGRNYIDDAEFERAGLRVAYQDYHHPVYPQLHGDFIPYLSIIDLLLNCGDDSLRILLSTGREI